MFDTITTDIHSLAPEAPTLEYLEAEICELGAHLTAGTCRWLLLIGEFDRREGWGGWGVRSCAHWLNWKCGLAMSSAHEHVRVARRLPELPAVTAAFGSGALSYSKVRALTRVATPETEEELVELAKGATAAHVERLARAYRQATRDEELDDANRHHSGRHLRWHHDDDGFLIISARLAPEEGAAVVAALRAIADSSAEESRTASDKQSSAEDAHSDSSAQGGAADVKPGWFSDEDRPATGDPSGARKADALVVMAEMALATGPRSRSGGERNQVVVHVDAATLAHGCPHGRCELADGPALAAETVLRLGCDAGVVTMAHGASGETLDVGRRTRSIPPAIRRALEARDKGCRFPACSNRRFVDGHHIQHWAEGGETKLSNLVLLCRRHHRLVHEGGFTIEPGAAGELLFRRSDGKPVHARPVFVDPAGRAMEQASRDIGLDIGPQTGESRWSGEALDLDLAIHALLDLEGRGQRVS